MNILAINIIPVTKARAKLGDLAKKVAGKNYVVLTKGGKPEAALVDIDYLTELEKEVERIYQKTFIDPRLLPLTREFSNQEIKAWLKEDQL
ncbi:hypothetical protein COU97_02650 [Candidatus Shapirobacteria bacterium CG10_big_fil_rev_8_21_14_0_10_48_15]|uniref:Uncharacterized protein n=1 Tax=Candidatus Shapirobacteria bacterium CG10_big_fil_rev_8_21_14_0_10_48_15 TaxID=1974484 RepID=A0A2M8L6U1_9BACT|nr:MAG: hypothetical protein COU97_02650 [Candidatus Shapirobacteria bacterium CG10_big_fil_rev_8_21_14_0_10_48_15]